MTSRRCTLVTGAAGFIGFHTAKRLLEAGEDVVGIDNINDYYDVSLKEARLRFFGGDQFSKLRHVDIHPRRLGECRSC